MASTLPPYIPLRGKRVKKTSRTRQWVPGSPETRFWAAIDKTVAAPCWLIRSGAAPGNKPRMKVDGEMVLTHRFAYELQNGPIPDGMDVHQSCQNELCMRGEHLVAGPRNTYKRPERPTTPPQKGRYASKDWKDIPGHLGYEASIHGEIRSWWVRGRSHYAARPRLLKLTPNTKSGYLYAMLVTEHGRKNVPVHLLVLNTFKGPCPPGHEGRHFPYNDKANNKLSNLSWSTHQENMIDREWHGTVPRGETHYMRKNPELIRRGDDTWPRKHPERIVRGSARPDSKISGADYDRVLFMLELGIPQSRIAAELGVSQERISAIKTGKRKR